MKKPLLIKIKSEMIVFTTSDGEYALPLKLLRDECPCAGCKGETILLHTYLPAEQPAKTASSYKIKAISSVGEYAVQIGWADGHDTGIYSWEYLDLLLSRFRGNVSAGSTQT